MVFFNSKKNVYILASRDPGDTTDYMQRSVTLVFAKPFPPRLFHLITTVLLPLLVLYNPLWLAGLKTPTNHLTVVATDYVSVRDSSRIHFTQSILPCFVLFICTFSSSFFFFLFYYNSNFILNVCFCVFFVSFFLTPVCLF